MCLLLSIPRPTQAESPDASDLQHAIARGSAWLRGDMQTWRSEHQCGACHHGPLALFSLGALAGEQEMSSPRFLSELARWSVSDEARLMPKDPQPARLALPAVYLSLGLNSVNDRGDDLATARQRLLDHLRQTQNADGSWTGPGGRPPVFASPVEVTLLVLASWEPRRMESPETSAMLDKAAAWLRTQPAGNSHQELALRTLWLSLRGESESARLLVDRLKALQQPDGGWRQADDVPATRLRPANRWSRCGGPEFASTIRQCSAACGSSSRRNKPTARGP